MKNLLEKLGKTSWKRIALLFVLVLALYSWIDLTNPNKKVLSEAKAAVEPSGLVDLYQAEKLSDDTFLILNTATSEARVYSFKKKSGRLELDGVRLEASFKITDNLPDYRDYSNPGIYGQRR